MKVDQGSVPTAVGVFLAAGALGLSVRQARTSFEDGLNREYRNLAWNLPVEALLGETGAPAGSDQFMATLNDFYRYVDLTNEQVFLRKRGRIRRSTWRDWVAGIEGNLSRPQFWEAWDYIQERAPDDFRELRHLVASGYSADPAPLWRRGFPAG